MKENEWRDMDSVNGRRRILLKIKTSPNQYREVEGLWINGQWDFEGMLFFKPIAWRPIPPKGETP